MTHLAITPNLDLNPWTDLKPDQMVPASFERIGLLPAGTTGGKASVAILAITPDGKPVIIQTTWALFRTAAAALAESPVAQMEDL